ncbi:MAG: hypothetical protein HQL44_07170 [Alphaproteobacteria bacterium]|nr:hypothetical protein [Alphaproteobacteria bacterium]
MNRKLWTVFSDHRLVAVVAADRIEGAHHIVAALEQRNDLPARPDGVRVMPCGKRQANKVLRQAELMGIGNQFLAFLMPGIFMTGIGGLSAA